MNNGEKLREIMHENSLKPGDIADLIDVTAQTVRSWLVDESSIKYRPMKNRDFDYLRLKMKEKAPKKRG